MAVLSQITRLTDGRTEFSLLDRVCILRSAVKHQSYLSYCFYCCICYNV